MRTISDDQEPLPPAFQPSLEPGVFYPKVPRSLMNDSENEEPYSQVSERALSIQQQVQVLEQQNIASGPSLAL